MEHNTHIDMQQVIEHIYDYKAQDTITRAIVGGDSKALQTLGLEGNKNILLSEEIQFGERQVESLLRFVVDHPLGLAMEDADADNFVYDALGEHRILGKKKKKKTTRSY